MKLIIDRIIDDIVICETDDSQMIDFPIALFAEEIHVGDHLIYDELGITVDHQATLEAKQNIEARFKRLFKRRK